MRNYEPPSERIRQRRSRIEKEAPSQRGMGDLAAEFRDVTEGFETMHNRIPDPIMTTEAERAGLDQLDDKAAKSATETQRPIADAADRFESIPDSKTDPGGLDLDLDVPEPGMEEKF